MDIGFDVLPDDHKPWSIPDDFPDPDPAAAAVLNLQDLSHQQLLERAAQRNHEQGIHEDPFVTALKGIPERAKLRPGSKEPESFYMGLHPSLRPHGKYARAWRKIDRGHKEAFASGKVPPAKRTRAAAAAAQAGDGKAKASTKAAAKAAANQPSQWTWQQLQPSLTSEQTRWRQNLGAFLGREVDVPLFAPGAPALDLQKLFIEVMAQGGTSRLAEGGWTQLAQYMQREPSFGPLLAAVYDCYLHPLEQDLPFAYRAAKAQDHMSSKVQARHALGAKVASHDSVVYSADQAAALMQHLQQVQARAALQQQQQQAGTSRSAAAATPAAAGSSQTQSQQQQQHGLVQVQQQDVARQSLLLLQQAACDPLLVVKQFKRQRVLGGLHPASKQATMAECRRKLVATRKRNRGPELPEHQPDDILFGLGSDTDGTDNETDNDGASDVDADASQPTSSAAAAAAAGGEPPPEPDAVASGGGSSRGQSRDRGGRAAGSSGGKAAGSSGGRKGRVRSRRGGQAAEEGEPAAAVGVDEAASMAAGDAASGAPEPGAAADVEGAAAAEATATTLVPQQQQQQQQQPGEQESQQQSDGLMLDTSRWLLLSRRAVLSGPPGCRKPLLQLPGVKERVPVQVRRRVSGNSRGRGRGGRGGVVAGEKKRTRTYIPPVPRCGSCHTCLNPQLKKACPVNRAQKAKGLPFITPRRGRGKKQR